jgi:putative lipoprotein (rSAM/lipoprotein system)
MLGFAGCEKEPLLDYTIKGTVVNKATREPIKGIRVGYSCTSCPIPMYGIPSAPFKPKSYVITDAKGEFRLTDSFFPEKNLTLPVFFEDIDGEENGLFQTEFLRIDMSIGNTVTVNVELTEVEKQN